MKIFTGVVTASLLLLVGTGCISTAPNTNPESAPDKSIEETESKPQPVIGQTYGDFKVTEIDAGSVTLTGTAEVTGTYEVSDLTGSLCFTPDQASAFKIPDLSNNRESKSFCFSNSDEAKHMLGEAGKATVVIDGYWEQVPGLSAEPKSKLIDVR